MGGDPALGCSPCTWLLEWGRVGSSGKLEWDIVDLRCEVCRTMIWVSSRRYTYFTHRVQHRGLILVTTYTAALALRSNLYLNRNGTTRFKIF